MDILFIAILVICLIAELIDGFSSGEARKKTKLIFLAVRGIISLMLAAPLTEFLLSQFADGKLNLSEQLGDLAEASPLLAEFADKLPAMITAPVMFIALNIVLKILFIIPVAVINAPKKKGKEGSKGALLGAVSAVLVFVLFVTPFTGIASFAGEATSYISDENYDKLTDSLSSLSFASGIDISKILSQQSFTNACAKVGDPILQILTTVKINGENISLASELDNLRPVLSLINVLKDGSLGAEDITAALPLLFTAIQNSEILAPALQETVKSAAYVWSEGRVFLGIDPSDSKNAFIVEFAQNNWDNLNEETISALAESLSGLGYQFDELQEKISGGNLENILKSEALGKVLESMQDNPVLSDTVNTVVDTALKTALQTYGKNMSESQIDSLAEAISGVKTVDDLTELMDIDNADIPDFSKNILTDYLQDKIDSGEWTEENIKNMLKGQ